MRKKLIAMLMLLPVSAMADDAELYEPAPPADSAFVRVINADVSSAVIKLADINYEHSNPPFISSYRVVPAGKQDFSLGEKESAFSFSAGNFYSLLLREGKMPALVQDELLENPAKGRLYFYNLSEAKDAEVISPDHQNAMIVEKVLPGTGVSREINAVTLSLQVKAEGKEVSTFDKVQLKRRAGETIVLTGKEPPYRVIIKPNAVAR